MNHEITAYSHTLTLAFKGSEFRARAAAHIAAGMILRRMADESLPGWSVDVSYHKVTIELCEGEKAHRPVAERALEWAAERAVIFLAQEG